MMANSGGADVVPLLGAIVVCYGWGEGDGQLWGSGRGAIAGCHCSVLWFGEGDDQLWGSGRGAVAGCHCWVPLQGARGKGDDQLWGSGRGAIAGCHIRVSL